MSQSADPWDQRAARLLVQPLVASPITPNQLTVTTLVVAFAGAIMLASPDTAIVNWGAGLFALSRFLDHFDGELARQKQLTSRLGYYLDYLAGAGSYGAMFIGAGIGLSHGTLGWWAYGLGILGGLVALSAMFLNLAIDRERRRLALDGGKDAVGYPRVGGFEMEDGIYLFAPLTWLGFLEPFFVAAGLGAMVYGVWTLTTLARLRRMSPA